MALMHSLRQARFRRVDRLRKSKDFQRLSRFGERRRNGPLVVLTAPARTGRSCLGLTVSRRVGKAVVRNRVKRQIREWFRTSRCCLGEPLDIVVIARPGAGELEGLLLRRRLSELFPC